ncbi:MAG TPA: YdeI/OmpD-associated family protein, partial [Gaiellaceae bacterium]|nr:YdeI/OmpD-associated family protein [Gaiellaceae bacterium]
FAPRKPRSTWSTSNKERVARLEREGLLAPAGIAAIEVAKKNGSWNALDAVERLEEPPDLATALDAEAAARENWKGFSPSSRKGILWWVASAKRPETRAKRVEQTVRMAAKGLRAQFDRE